MIHRTLVTSIATRCRTAVILPAVLAPSLVASAQPTAVDPLTGTWSVSYSDALFEREHGNGGLIQGTAFVSRGRADLYGNAPYQVMVQLQDPKSGRNFELRSKTVTVNERQVTMQLHGRSPSLSRTEDGKANVREWFPDAGVQNQPGRQDHTLVTVRTRTTLDIHPAGNTRGPTIDAQMIDGTIPATQDIMLKLTLDPQSGALSGTWSYPMGDTGMYGRRVGQLRANGKVVTGQENWSRSQSDSILDVKELTDARQKITGESATEPAVRTKLRIRGWDLPTTAAQLGHNVSFDDSLISFHQFESARGAGAPMSSGPRTPGELVIAVNLSPGILPGDKPMRIATMRATWALEFPAAEPVVHYMVKKDGESKRALVLPHGQQFTIECRFRSSLPFSHRLARLELGDELNAVTIPLTESANDPGLFRSDQLKIVEPSPQRSNSEPGRVPLPIRAGRSLRVTSGDSAEHEYWSSIEVVASDALTKPKIILFPVGGARWQSDASITHITKEEPFGLRLRMPGSTKQNELKVRFQVKDRWQSHDLPVQRVTTGTDQPFAYYAPSGRLTMARGQSDWWLGYVLPLDLVDTNNGDIVEVSYGDGDSRVVQTVRVYDTKLKKRLAVRRQQVTTLADAAGKLRAMSNLSAKDKQLVELKWHLANNALLLVDRQEFWDLHRVLLLEAYLTMLQEPADWHSTSGGRHPKYGIVLVSQREQQRINQVITVEARQQLGNALTGLGHNLGLAVVEFVISGTGAGGIYTAVTGYTTRGKPVNMLLRVFAGLEALSNIMNTAYASSGSAGKSAFVKSWMNKVNIAGKKSPESRALLDPQRVKSRYRHFQSRFRKLGFSEQEAARRARDLAQTSGELSTELAFIGHAAESGIPATELIRRLDMSAKDIAEALEDYFKRGPARVDDQAARQQLIKNYLRNHADEVPELAWSDLDDFARGPATPSRSASVPPGFESSAPTSLGVERFNDLDFDVQAGIAKAQLPHRGRGEMNDLFGRQMKMHRAIAKEKGLSEDDIQRAMEAAQRKLTEEHRVVDLIEKARHWREYRDYGAARVFLNKGAKPREAAIGHLYLNELDTHLKPSFITSQLRKTHQAIPQAMGIDRATWRNELNTFLKRNYPDMPQSSINDALRDYFRFVDGGPPPGP